MNKRVIAFISILFCTLINSTAQYFLKKASNNFVFDISLLLNYNLFLGGALYAVSLLFYLYALKHENLSTVSPLLSLQYVFVFMISFFFFHEVIFFSQIIGLILITLGVAFVASEVKS